MATYVLSTGEGSATLIREYEIVCGRPMARITAEDLASWAHDALLGTCYGNSNLADALANFEESGAEELIDCEEALLLVLNPNARNKFWVRLDFAASAAA